MKSTEEAARTFNERFEEYLKAPLLIHGHQSTTGHTTKLNNFSIVAKRGRTLSEPARS